MKPPFLEENETLKKKHSSLSLLFFIKPIADTLTMGSGITKLLPHARPEDEDDEEADHPLGKLTKGKHDAPPTAKAGGKKKGKGKEKEKDDVLIMDERLFYVISIYIILYCFAFLYSDFLSLLLKYCSLK